MQRLAFTIVKTLFCWICELTSVVGHGPMRRAREVS